MMFEKWLYALGLRGYTTAITLAAPMHSKAKKMLTGRRQLLQQIQQAMQGNTQPVAWFHCASLGEFEQGRPVIEAFREAYPHIRIFLTFFSPSGYEVRKNYAGADWVFYLPLDSPTHAQVFLDAVKPRLVVFVKYEFWYYYLQELKNRNIPTLLISAIFRPNQIFFKPYGGLYRQMLDNFSLLFVQNEESAALLRQQGVTHQNVAGDTRFDRVLAISRQATEIPLAKAFAGDTPVLVVGSSWQADIAVLAPLIKAYQGRVKFIVAPHELGENGLKQTAESLGVKTVRYTKTSVDEVGSADVLLVDTIGLLSSLYALGSWAYIGGSFGKGLHNTLEAAVWGIPLFFGNCNYQKFAEARRLIELGAAFEVANSTELLQVFSVLFEEEDKRKKAGNAASSYVQESSGATAKIITYIKELL